MKEKAKIFYNDKTSRFLLFSTILLILLQLILLAFKLPQLPLEVPLFYSLSWGIKRLAPAVFLFIFPFFSILFLIINYIFAVKTYNSDLFLSRIFFITTTIFALLSLIGLWNIINII